METLSTVRALLRTSDYQVIASRASLVRSSLTLYLAMNAVRDSQLLIQRSDRLIAKLFGGKDKPQDIVVDRSIRPKM